MIIVVRVCNAPSRVSHRTGYRTPTSPVTWEKRGDYGEGKVKQVGEPVWLALSSAFPGLDTPINMPYLRLNRRAPMD